MCVCVYIVVRNAYSTSQPDPREAPGPSEGVHPGHPTLAPSTQGATLTTRTARSRWPTQTRNVGPGHARTLMRGDTKIGAAAGAARRVWAAEADAELFRLFRSLFFRATGDSGQDISPRARGGVRSNPETRPNAHTKTCMPASSTPRRLVPKRGWGGHDYFITLVLQPEVYPSTIGGNRLRLSS